MPDSEPPKRRLPHLLVAVLAAVLGFAMTVQINQLEQDTFAVRGTELVELLKSLDAANERIAAEIDELSSRRAELENSTKLSVEAQQEAEQRASELAILAGTAGARGPGIELTIDDPSGLVDAALLLDIVQELRDGGAEAIVVNGSARVVAQTFFADDEGRVRVGGRTVSAPYVIEAIGDPGTLAGAMRIRGGVLDRIDNRGAHAVVVTKRSITITALADVRSPEYARPVS